MLQKSMETDSNESKNIKFLMNGKKSRTKTINNGETLLSPVQTSHIKNQKTLTPNSSDYLSVSKEKILKSAKERGVNIGNSGKDVYDENIGFDLLRTLDAQAIVTVIKGLLESNGGQIEYMFADEEALNAKKKNHRTGIQ